ncbi:META domain-containing protein [Dysgonomonas sp. Marseille-P4677]|uniref:META domain-containing protein n=1 Tax=Dysgonomonas sp. Marseille-P4677 TaxID=2364790 RepID=UPI0019147DBF|nr:META domain-containing protein [Dysgonomonas sp. Marseille-P4677]MBK5722265.1 META domain-containing protein [Dysgonomonas sp. Marseille-P4677]
MKTLRYIVLLISVLFVFQINAQDVPKEQLTDKWILKIINNRPASELFTNKTPYIIFNFDIEQISGNSGCNMFSGKFNYGGGKFEAPNIESGKNICSGSSDETQFFKLLNKSSKLSMMNGELIFTQDDKPVLIFYRSKPLSSSDLIGVWKLQTIDGDNVKVDASLQIPTLEFNFPDNQVSGNTSCNTYNALFFLSKNVLEVQSLTTTRMVCDKMDMEQEFVKIFNGRMDINLEDDILVIRKDNKELLTFTR